MRNSVRSFTRWVAALAVVCGGTAAQAAPLGFVTLSGSGDQVLTRCNPRHLAQRYRCRVASLPGESGYTLVAARSSDIVKNDVVIGRLLDRVWRRADGSHILGAQIQLNASAFDLTGLSFNANDLFRRVRDDRPVAVAYYQGSATKALQKAGRTLQGLNELAPEPEDETDAEADVGDEAFDFTGAQQPLRDNAWVDFRIDANAAETSGTSSAHSPWLLVKTKAPAGVSLQAFAIRLLSSDFADASQFTEIFLPAYQPN